MISFFNAVLPNIGFYYLVTPNPKGFGFIHYSCSTIDEMIVKANQLDSESQTVYFACASFKQKSYQDVDGKVRFRTAENAGWAKAFWLDIDCGPKKAEEGKGYLSANEAKENLHQFIQDLGLPVPMIVSSGGGLHVYWTLTETISKDEWRPVADKFKSLTHKRGLLADDSRTSDIASILRPVGTHNWKPAHGGKEVRLKLAAKPSSFTEFQVCVESAYGKYCTPKIIKSPIGNVDFPDFSRHLIMSKMKRRGLYATHQIYRRI